MNSHINQDNDWATAPPTDAEYAGAFMETQYIKSIAKHQLAIFNLRQKRAATRYSRWACSSSLRAAFGNLMLVGFIDNQPYTITEIADLLNCSRQAATQMVADCIAEEWITMQSKQKYVGTACILDNHKDYLRVYQVATEQTDVVQMGQAYRAFMKCKPTLHCNRTLHSVQK
tara:strand:- start:121 stop:636 length:516 start_codon:yes stop_codon:yes gene_type:complete